MMVSNNKRIVEVTMDKLQKKARRVRLNFVMARGEAAYDELIRMFKSGEPLERIGKRFSFTRQRAKSVMDSLGVMTKVYVEYLGSAGGAEEAKAEEPEAELPVDEESTSEEERQWRSA